MRSMLFILAAGTAVILTQDGPASAQYVNSYGNMGRSYGQAPYLPPVVSPWLNLTGGGLVPYNLRVLPEFDRQNFQQSTMNNFNFLSAAIPGLQQAPLEIGAAPLAQTGHLSAFRAYGSFYNFPKRQQPFYPYNPYQARMMSGGGVR